MTKFGTIVIEFIIMVLLVWIFLVLLMGVGVPEDTVNVLSWILGGLGGAIVAIRN